MDQEKNTQIETPEELEAEKTHLAEVKEDEIREQVISEYGFDEEEDKERIDKLVAKEMGYKKTISTAIGQKIKYRDKVSTPPKQEPEKDSPDVDSKIKAALEADRLEAMEYPDDIKEVIKSVADINKISVRKATSDPYVASRIEKWRKDNEAAEAAVNRNPKSGKGTTEGDEIPDFDLTTEEGRKDWDKWKEDQIAAGN